MLLSQYGGRREHGYLSAVHDCLECCAHGHFSFAETNIAADQAVHRARTFHVDLGVNDRFHLVRRFAKRERTLKFCLPFCVRGECVTGVHLPLCLNRKHFARVIKNGRSGFNFGAGPFSVAEGA